MTEEINEIHLLVYPFFDFKAADLKIKNWQKEINKIANSKGKIFIIKKSPYSVLDSKIKYKTKKLEEEFINYARKQLNDKLLVSTNRFNFEDILKHINKQQFVFKQKVKLNCYGQHAGLCVPEISNQIKSFLDLHFKINPEIKEIRRNSVKNLNEALAQLIISMNKNIFLEYDRTLNKLNFSSLFNKEFFERIKTGLSMKTISLHDIASAAKNTSNKNEFKKTLEQHLTNKQQKTIKLKNKKRKIIH